MKTKVLKTLALLMAAVLLVTATVLATMAYLTSTSAVSNVFTVGDVKINMYESKVNNQGEIIEAVPGTKTADTNSYHLLPGKTYTKDPTVYVEANCDPSYLFVRLRNDLKTIEKGGAGTPTILEQLNAHGWYEIERAESNIDAVFVYVGTDEDKVMHDVVIDGVTKSVPKAKLVGGSAAREAYDVFDTFSIKDQLDSGVSLQAFGGARVAIVAYAIQADLSGFTAEQRGTYDAYKSAWEYIKTELPFVV